MVDTPQSDASHDSDGGANGSGQGQNPAAAKDKECPYCHQRFTSSSLGRHLDQYISKKRPDGIHNIEEIRRQRGGITRRTPRQASSAKHGRAGSQPARTSSLEARSPPPANIDLLNGKVEGGVGTKLNALTWHSTGVINDLDAHKLMAQTTRALTPTSTKRSWRTYETGQRDAPDSRVEGDKDTVRALELALREVLDSLQAASARAAASIPGASPFDFDVQAQTFPSLCLLLLPFPPTLFSTAPFGTPTSFPIDPPGPVHLDCVHLKLQTVIHRWKWDALGAAQRASYPNPVSSAANLREEHEFLSRTAQQHEDIATKHLELAYAQWMSVSEEQRTKQWQLELARAFVSEQEKRKEAEERVGRVQEEATQLQAQVEMLSRCQWPREMALWPPERVPVGNKVMKELKLELKKKNAGNASYEDEGGSDSRGEGARWNFERLVGKWKRVVKEDKARRTGVLAAQQRLPDVNETAPLPPSHQMAPQMAALDSPASAMQDIQRGGAANGEEPRRRSGRTHVGTNKMEQDDAVREVNDALMVNGSGEG